MRTLLRSPACLVLAGMLLTGAAASAAAVSPQDVRSVTAITEVFGDGQKVSAVAVEYAAAVRSSDLKTSSFTVEGKKVTKVYANTSAAKAAQGTDGRWVIVEIDTAIQADIMMTPQGPGVGAAPGAGGPPGGGPKLGQKATEAKGAGTLSAKVTQTAPVALAAGGTSSAWTAPAASTKTVNLLVDEFRQGVFTDPAYGNKKLMYNLFVPRNYDPAKKYPLVLFMHDAGVVSLNPTYTLTQGLGAVVWTSPEEQAKHECFVLAPQYDEIIADDTSTTTDMMDITVNLVKSLMTQYSLDPNKLYNTGQSMGGMTSIAMDIKYPDLFAASWLVACQWDPAKVAPLAGKPLWIIVSAGDTKANPGQDAIVAELVKKGDTVAKASWKAEASARDTAQAVQALSTPVTIHYAVFEGGSHRYTWQYAYGIAGVRDWLLAQSRP